jgi:pre-mRNA-processing factor 19
MSVTTCALSGQPLEYPVVSLKSGHVFEKRLIEEHISKTGQCPVTGMDLDKSELISLQVAKTAKPRPPVASSIPGILSILQTEWDTLMLETYNLK